MHRLLTGLLDIAMTPNTDSRDGAEPTKLTPDSPKVVQRSNSGADSRELDKALKHLVIRQNRMYGRLDKKEIAQIIEICLAYTTNKQKELLEWVEQESPKSAVAVLERRGIPHVTAVDIAHDLNHAQRKQLKNKKESL